MPPDGGRAEVLTSKEVGDPDNFDLTKSRWTLADGKSVSGTGWAKLRANSPVPNLCGVFLRGKNNGVRKDVRVPELDLGQYDSDLVGDHKHDMRTQLNGGGAGAGTLWDGGKGTVVGVNDLVGGVHYESSDHEPHETRPKNVTVNFFVKVND